MKNKKLIRTFTVLLAALVIMGGFSVTAYAGGGEEYDYTEPEQTAEPEEETGGYEPQPLTPEGNISLLKEMRALAWLYAVSRQCRFCNHACG